MTALTRRPNGTMLPGHTPNPGGRPRTAIEQIREKYGHRIPELIENLFELTRTGSESTKLAANRELLDRIIGKPQQVIEAITAKVDVGAMYLAALQRARNNSHVAPSEPVIDGDDDDNSNAGSPRDPTEIIQ
jgi:hypothetical protein